MLGGFGQLREQMREVRVRLDAAGFGGFDGQIQPVRWPQRRRLSGRRASFVRRKKAESRSPRASYRAGFPDELRVGLGSGRLVLADLKAKGCELCLFSLRGLITAQEVEND